MMTRKDKYEVFNKFFTNSEKWFSEQKNINDNHPNTTQSYGFFVAPGSRNGGLDDRVVEVFFGHRPYRISKTINNQLQWETQTEIARGATLHYQQFDNGDVFVVLHPAYTESHKPTEEVIVLNHLKNPKKLLNKKTIKKHWKCLSSYMAVTSIEVDYTIIDKLRIAWLRFVKQTIPRKDMSGLVYETRIGKISKNIVKQILTVGFSGFLLSFIPFFINRDKNSEIEEKLNVLLKQQTYIIELSEEIKEQANLFNDTSTLNELETENTVFTKTNNSE
jgi:hypothetical protein